MNRKKMMILLALLTTLLSSVLLTRCGSGLSGASATGSAAAMKY